MEDSTKKEVRAETTANEAQAALSSGVDAMICHGYTPEQITQEAQRIAEGLAEGVDVHEPPPLSVDQWLDKHGAVCVRSERVGVDAVAWYSVGGGLVIVQIFEQFSDSGPHGWELFVVPCKSNGIAETLEAADRILGLEL